MVAMAQPWFEDLTDSVRALGEAAREYQLAHAAARNLRAGVDPDRRRLLEGKVAGQPEATAKGWHRAPVTREPHADAVFTLTDTYGGLVSKLGELYENAALCYAAGCAWAICTVQAGHNPNGVILHLGDDRRTLLPGSFQVEGLERYAQGKQVAAAYERLAVCLDAAGYAADLDRQHHLLDHEAAWMHDALDVAAGTADAAYTYGVLAERAVQFTLIEPRRQFLRRQAEDAQQA
jgi:hypothetical protein